MKYGRNVQWKRQGTNTSTVFWKQLVRIASLLKLSSKLLLKLSFLLLSLTADGMGQSGVEQNILLFFNQVCRCVFVLLAFSEPFGPQE